jgi:hypothetical protein
VARKPRETKRMRQERLRKETARERLRALDAKRLLGLELTPEERWEYLMGDWTPSNYIAGDVYHIRGHSYVVTEPKPETKQDPKPATRVGVQMRVDPRKGYVLPERKK